MEENNLKIPLALYIRLEFSCLHLPTFTPKAEIVSEKSSVFTFSYRKAIVTQFDLAVIDQGHSSVVN